MKLNARQQQFVEEYLVDLNATKAAERANYSKKTARSQGQRLLTNVDIAAAIAEAGRKRLKATGIDAQKVLVTLDAMVDADLADILADDGSFKPVKQWPLVWRRMVKTYEVTPIYERSKDGADASWDLVGYKHKVTFEKGNKALELLGKHTDVGAFVEKVEQSGDFTFRWLTSEDETA